MKSLGRVLAIVGLATCCANVAWATFGPCEEDGGPAYINTIACGPLLPDGTHNGCAGGVTIMALIMKCQDEDEIYCPEAPDYVFVMYSPKAVAGPGPCISEVGILYNTTYDCIQDLTTRITFGVCDQC